MSSGGEVAIMKESGGQSRCCGDSRKASSSGDEELRRPRSKSVAIRAERSTPFSVESNK